MQNYIFFLKNVISFELRVLSSELKFCFASKNNLELSIQHSELFKLTLI